MECSPSLTSVGGSVTNNGTVSPGSSPGRINITGSLVLGNVSKLWMELGGYATGQFDVVTVNGSVKLGGTLSVSLIGNFQNTMTNGAGFTLLTAGSPLIGAFANVPSGGTLITTDGYARFTVRYAGENSVRLTDLVILNPDSDGDGVSDADELAAGTDPHNAGSVFRIVAVQPQAGGLRIVWSAVGGKSYVVQTNAPPASGSVINNFADFSPLITVPGTGESTTNFLDIGAPTNLAARYYRVRLGP